MSAAEDLNSLAPVRWDESLERSVVGGAIALDLAGAYSERIRAEDFAHPVHGMIWTAAVTASKAGRVSVHSVISALKAIRRINTAGGEHHVSLLLAYAPTCAEDFESAVREFAAGALARRLRAASMRVAKRAADDGVSADELASWALEEIGSAVARSNAGDAVSIDRVIDEHWDEIDARAKSGTVQGVSTGLVRLDASLSRLRPGQLVIVAGRPGSAKTSLAMHVAHAVARDGGRSLVWSLEMPRRDLGRRLLCSLARVSISSVITNAVSDEEGRRLMDASQRLSAYRSRLAFFDDESTFEDIEAGTLREHQREPVSLVVIDHLQHVSWSRNTRDERQHLGRVAKGAKKLAKKIDAPVLLLSQLSRKIEEREDKRPMLSDLFGSGEIEAAADVVLGIYRDEYYDPSSPRKGTAELGILKQRDGATGVEFVEFEARCTRFGDLEGTVE
jgi:replicative DNA helicase